MNVTEQLIKYLFEKSKRSFPENVIEQAKRCLLDYIGVAYAGAAENPEKLRRYTERISAGGDCCILGTGKKADASTAAFVNGFNAHIMELDDGHRFGMIHLAAPITSAVLAAAEKEKADGKLLLKAIVMGYEAAVRLALSIQPEHKKRGFHTAGTCGTVGAAFGTGMILKLDETQMKAALSAAASSAAGLLEIQENGSELKPYNTANAAMTGVNAAYFALTGYCGPEDCLGGPRGTVNVLSAGADIQKMTEHQDYFEIERIYLKPYAACRHCHSAIEAAAELRKEIGIPPEDIASVDVFTYKLAVRGHDHREIQGIPAAKLSIPFCVATAYILQDCGPNVFTKTNLTDPHILSLTDLVSVTENKAFSELSPAKRIAEVHIRDKNNRAYSKRVDFAKGDPENPMSYEDVILKFKSLMKHADESEKSESIISAVMNIEADASPLYTILS